MANYAHIENGKVVNTVLADEEFAATQGWVLIPEGILAGIAWDYVDGQFLDNRPKPEIPLAPPAPTKEDLIAQLAELTAKINALGA